MFRPSAFNLFSRHQVATDLKVPCDDESDVNQHVFLYEKTSSLYKQWMFMVGGGFFGAIGVVVSLWDVVNKVNLLAWFAVYAVFVGSRTISCVREAQQMRSAESYSPIKTLTALNRYRFFSVLHGVIWGLVPIVAFTHDFALFSIVLTIHAGFVAAPVVATASYDLKSYYAFVVPATVLWAAGFLVNGGDQFIPHAVLIVFFPIFLTGFALQVNKAFDEQIHLRLKNANLNRDLRTQRDKAESAMLEKNRFLAAASHDLRQPVHALGLFVASLEPRLVEDESKKLIANIKQTTENLGSLFHSLLDISKLDAKVVNNLPRHFYLHRLLKTLHAEYRKLADQKGFEIVVYCDEAIVCHADPSLVELIMRNYLSNAINYTDSGRVVVNVIESSAKQITVECVDTGKGIPKSEHTKIFSEYHQLENPERDRQKGLGLGLAIVKRVAELMQAKIDVVSESGRGSTFSVTLPRGKSVLVPPRPVVNSKLTSMHLNIVVIDDEVEILMGMHALLLSWGSNVITASSGQEAMAKLIGNVRPDMLVVDYRLRNHESGLDVIEQIRKELNNPALPAILITGDTGASQLKETAQSSVYVLHKPVEPEMLKTVLSNLLVKESKHSAGALSAE